MRLLRLLLLAITLACAFATAAPAHAAGADVTVLIDRLSPAAPTSGSTLRIHGRLINTSDRTATSLVAQLRRSTYPLSDTAQLDRPDTVDDLALPAASAAVAQTLRPGESAEFTLEIPVDSMGLTSPGAYAIAVQALGSVDGSGPTDLGTVHTFVPWFPDSAAVQPVSVLWLWPLVDWPAQDPYGVLLNDKTPQELAPDGRLARLIDIGERFAGSVSWIADPALLQETSSMAAGYQVMVDGKPAIGQGEQDAADWLRRVSRIGASQKVTVLPYADIDASAVVRAGLGTDLVRAITQGPAVASNALGRSVASGLYWAPFGRLDRATTDVLASAGITTVVMSSDAMPAQAGAAPVSVISTSSGPLRALIADSRLTRSLDLPQATPSDAVLARQSWLAETAVLATTLPDTADRTVVVAPPSVRWDPSSDVVVPLLRALRSAPWLKATTLDDVLGQQPSSRPRGPYGPKAKSAELSPSYMGSVRKLNRQLQGFSSVVDDPTGLTEPFSAALLRSESSAWRTEPNVGRELLEATSGDLTSLMNGLHVLSKGTVTFSGDSGRVPVTIQNDLDRRVTVGLVLVGDPAVRLESQALQGISIDPGKMASIDVDARVIGGDPLTVKVQLLNPDGRAYGAPARITLASTAYARAASFVVGLAFIAIVVFVIIGVTRRIHKARNARLADNLER